MKGRFIMAKAIAEFKEHLILEERSEITIEKYIRDVKTFAKYTQNTAITKETVIAYKKHKDEFGSVNFLPISYDDRAIIDKLKKEGLIDNVRYIGMQAVRFDLTYDGLHYFDK